MFISSIICFCSTIACISLLRVCGETRAAASRFDAAAAALWCLPVSAVPLRLAIVCVSGARLCVRCLSCVRCVCAVCVALVCWCGGAPASRLSPHGDHAAAWLAARNCTATQQHAVTCHQRSCRTHTIMHSLRSLLLHCTALLQLDHSTPLCHTPDQPPPPPCRADAAAPSSARRRTTRSRRRNSNSRRQTRRHHQTRIHRPAMTRRAKTRQTPAQLQPQPRHRHRHRHQQHPPASRRAKPPLTHLAFPSRATVTVTVTATWRWRRWATARRRRARDRSHRRPRSSTSTRTAATATNQRLSRRNHKSRRRNEMLQTLLLSANLVPQLQPSRTNRIRRTMKARTSQQQRHSWLPLLEQPRRP